MNHDAGCMVRPCWVVASLHDLANVFSMSRTLWLMACSMAPLMALEQLTLLLPNDRSLPLGEIGSIEGSAVIARTHGASAAWYNPAGLAGQKENEVMASASLYDYSRIDVSSPFGEDSRRTLAVLPGAAGFSQVLPTWIGGDGQWGVGFLVATPVQWRTSVSQQEVATTATGSVSVSNKYDGTYEEYLPTLSLGRTIGGCRIGLSGAAVVHELSVSSSSDAVYLPSARTGSSSTQFHGRTVLLRLGAGWQWNDDAWALGATAYAPGIRIWRSGDRSDNQIINVPEGGTLVVGQGNSADYPLDLDSPATATLAVARTGSNWSCELNVSLSAGAPERDVYPSYSITTTQITNGVTTISESSVPPVASQRRTVVNGALGYSHRIIDDWAMHMGLSSDRSNIKRSQLFSVVDMWTAVAGVSVRGEHTLLTAGISTTWNTSGTSSSIDLPTGIETESTLSLRSWRGIVGSSYRF
jgi:hypothetical protein